MHFLPFDDQAAPSQQHSFVDSKNAVTCPNDLMPPLIPL